MSRAIKFRVYDSRFKKYIDASKVVIHAATGSARGVRGGDGWVDHWVVEQFTGLTDKNGVEIYEGDIAKVDDDVCLEVYYDDQDAAFALCEGKYQMHKLSDISKSLYEVIGNIHENPELLDK